MKIQNNLGFTAVEVMIGVGLTAVVTVALISTQVWLAKDQAVLKNQLEQSIDEKLAERIIFSDLSAVEPSFNNISLADDSGNNFFDYYPDVPANSLTTPLSRAITITSKTANQSVSLIVQNLSAGATLNYDPTAAYSFGTSSDFNVAGSYTFVSVNQNNWVKAIRPGFWIDGMTLMFDTPAKLRPLSSDGTVNMQVAPRSPVYVGVVGGAILNSVGNPFSGLIKSTQPVTGAAIPSVDSFLQNVPSIGGGQSVVRLRAISAIQYTLEADKTLAADCYPGGNKSGTPFYHSNLYKVIYKGTGQAGQKVLLADKVCSFSMSRDSVLKRMIYFKINKVDTYNNSPSDTSTASL
ncbi:MAG TPA: hypothetical protein VF412_00155 [Bdellovibrio sp.]|uniref:hypothetical protein n=1 Tax=Bdellovibrio sp. TaxID=28201 RepID=UPI002EFBCDC4